jgi:hypothetical protein
MFWQMVNLFCKNYETLLTAGAIMASMIIVLIGALKPLIFNKIQNKNLRGSLLSLTQIVFSFGAVALAFWWKNITFDYYWFASIVFSGFCVVLYWFYENVTQARAGIHKLGSFLWKKIAPIIRAKLDSVIDGLNDTKKLTNFVDDFVNTSDKKKTNKVNTNKDIKNL